MPINATVKNEQISVAVGETQIGVTVNGGVGPTGNSGTITVSAPVTNAGSSTAAVIGLATGTGLAVSGGSLVVSYGTTAGTACQGNDARLSDSREWSADTVSQAEAEAGTATTRRAFTALRVFQAIAAWWSASAAKAKLDGVATGATANATDAQLRDRSTHTGTQLAATISDFTTAVVAAAPPTTNASLLTSGTLADARLSANVVLTGDSRLSDARTPTSHAHGNITNAGAIGTTSGQIVVTGASGVLTTAATIGAASVSGLSAVATSGAYADLSGTPAAYSLPTATASVLGGVKIGSGISIDGNGVISASTGYVLPNATTTTLGGVIVGTGLGVTSGTLSVTYGTTSGTACQGNDSRLSDSRTPTDGSVTDAKITSGGLSASSINWTAIAPWAPSTAYAKGDLVSNAGIAYRRSAAGTSGTTFNVANWQQVTPSEFVGSQITSGTLSNALLTARARAAVNVFNWSSFR